MATKSFFQDMITDTQEAADRLWAAFYEADSGAPGIDISNAQKPLEDDEAICRLMKW